MKFAMRHDVRKNEQNILKKRKAPVSQPKVP